MSSRDAVNTKVFSAVLTTSFAVHLLSVLLSSPPAICCLLSTFIANQGVQNSLHMTQKNLIV